MNIITKINEALKVYTALEAARDSIVAAPVGSSVDAGVAKGIKLWGRVVDLELRPIIRK
jgi:hypothetical protein